MLSFIPDLTPYPKIRTVEPLQKVLISIGWLDGQHPYNQGDVSQKFIERLEIFCSNPMIRTFGVRKCTLCQEKKVVREVLSSGKLITLYGANEVRVPSKNRAEVYVAPELILHYVKIHAYQPPLSFIEAVLLAPLPGTSEYEHFAQMNSKGLSA